MKQSIRLSALLVALLFCLGLGGCGDETITSFDATFYVRGVLNETWKGDWNNAFLDLVNITDGAAIDAYEAAIAQEYRRFAYQFDFDDELLTDETRQAATELLQDICARASYSVGSAVLLDDTRYAVEVSVRPIDLFFQVKEDTLADFQRTFAEAYADTDLSAMTAEQQLAFQSDYENDWAMGIIGLCRDKMGLLAHREVVTMLVLVAPDNQGLYTMSDNDFSNLSALILPY